MKTFYPGYRLEKIAKTDRFVVVKVTGDALTPFPVCGYDRGDGKSKLDALSVSDKDCVLAFFRGQRRVKAWEDGGGIQVGAVGGAFIWDEPYRYWCVTDLKRPHGIYRYGGRAFPVAPGEQLNVSASGVEYYIVGDGRVTIDGEDCRIGSVYKTKGRPVSIKGVSDAVVLEVTEELL